jgi:hypothetical protein
LEKKAVIRESDAHRKNQPSPTGLPKAFFMVIFNPLYDAHE